MLMIETVPAVNATKRCQFVFSPGFDTGPRRAGSGTVSAATLLIVAQ